MKHAQRQPIPFKPNPTFLGVILDGGLTMRPMCLAVKSAMQARRKVMNSLRGRSWGRTQQSLRATYMGYALPKALYAASSWFTMASPTNQKLV